MTEEEIKVMQEELAAARDALAAMNKGGDGDEARKRLDFLETEHKKLISERDAAKAKARTEEEERLKKQGEFEALYTTTKAELDSLGEKATKYEESMTKYLEAEIAEIPEDKRALVPNLSTEGKLEWIKQAKAANLFTHQGNRAPGARIPGEGGGEGVNPWKKETRNLTEQGRITREDPALASQLKKDAGL